jgi:hypothetical protein
VAQFLVDTDLVINRPRSMTEITILNRLKIFVPMSTKPNGIRR